MSIDFDGNMVSRILKVIYIALYIPLLAIIPIIYVAWTENAPAVYLNRQSAQDLLNTRPEGTNVNDALASLAEKGFTIEGYNDGSKGSINEKMSPVLYSSLILVACIVYIVIIRLFKITFLYISFAQKPEWKKEFKRFF